MGLDESVQNIAGALKPSNQGPSARWRWGTVESVTEHGTMNVNVGGTSLMGIRAAQHCMGAQVGDRVRVLYCGTEAMVDAVRATGAWTPWEPDVLYDNPVGDSGTISLSASAADYTHMTIYYKTSDNTYGSTNVYSPNDKLVWLFDAFPNNGGLPTYIKFKVVSISGTTIAASGSRYSAGYFNSSGSSMAGSNAIYITHVEAW